MRKKRSSFILFGTLIALAASVMVASPANAVTWPYHDYYGGADCGSKYPDTSSYGSGSVIHEIEDGISGGYYAATFNNGSQLLVRVFKRDGAGSATWATFGYTYYWMQTSWYCSA